MHTEREDSTSRLRRIDIRRLTLAFACSGGSGVFFYQLPPALIVAGSNNGTSTGFHNRKNTRTTLTKPPPPCKHNLKTSHTSRKRLHFSIIFYAYRPISIVAIPSEHSKMYIFPTGIVLFDRIDPVDRFFRFLSPFYTIDSINVCKDMLFRRSQSF